MSLFSRVVLFVFVLATVAACGEPKPVVDDSASRPKPAKLDKNVMIKDK